jgi:hypothetical protein
MIPCVRCKRLHVEDLLDIASAAAHVGVEPETWRVYITRGTAPDPICRVGGSPAWTAAQLDAWERERPGQGAGAGRPPKKKASRKRGSRDR